MANKKLRLDMALVEQGFFPSRTRAQASIMAGEILVNGEVDTRADRTVLPEDKISIKEKSCPYVSRGGLKLAGAMKAWNISVQGKTCVDIGVATGGFSETIARETRCINVIDKLLTLDGLKYLYDLNAADQA